MQGKKLLIGIIALVLAIVFAFMFVFAPYEVWAGRIIFGDYFSKATLTTIAVFLFSGIASSCFFKKLGQRILHSNAIAVAISLISVLVAIVANCLGVRNITDILLKDLGQSVIFSIISVSVTLVSGFVAGFGMTIFDFSMNKHSKDTTHTVEHSNTGSTSVSKTVGAILAFLFGGLGVHRYYLGYKKQGAIQTCGFISIIIAYTYYVTNFIYGSVPSVVGAIFMLLLALYGSITSIWAFVDFIRILTGGLQPANGNTYSENRPQQVQIVQPKETASDTADAIAKLAKLHEQGILTDEEFQKKKTELLAKM